MAAVVVVLAWGSEAVWRGGAGSGLERASGRLVSREAARAPARHEVEIRGFAYRPAVLEVQAGDTVVWVNRDVVPHTATAAGDVGWDTGELAEGGRGEYVAVGVGEQRYRCELHPMMEGRLIVRRSERSGVRVPGRRPEG